MSAASIGPAISANSRTYGSYDTKVSASFGGNFSANFQSIGQLHHIRNHYANIAITNTNGGDDAK